MQINNHCLSKIKMLKKVIPYTLNHDKHGTLSLPSIKTSNYELTQMPNQAIKSYFSRFSFFNSHATLELKPWSWHFGWPIE